MLALATDVDSQRLASTSAFWTCDAGRHIRFLAGTYRVPPRARPLLRAAVLTATQPGPLLTDRHGRIFLARRMANLVRRAADRVGIPMPPAAHPSSPWDRSEPSTQTQHPQRHQQQHPAVERRENDSAGMTVRGRHENAALDLDHHRQAGRRCRSRDRRSHRPAVLHRRPRRRPGLDRRSRRPGVIGQRMAQPPPPPASFPGGQYPR